LKIYGVCDIINLKNLNLTKACDCVDYLWLVVLFALGVMMAVKPELLWKIEHIFTVKNGEPTELYITLMRLGGGFFVIASIICAVIIIL